MGFLRAVYRRGMGWYHASLLPRFVFSMALAGLVFILVAVFFVQNYFNPELARSVEQVERDYLEMQSGNVRALMRACRNMVFECVIDRRVLKHAIAYQNSPANDRAYAEQRLHDVMRGHLSERGDAVAYTVYMPDGSYVYYNKLKTTVGLGWFGWAMGQDYSARMKALCERADRLGTMQIDILPRCSVTGGMRFFHMAFPLMDLYTHRHYGVVVLSFDAAEVNLLVNPRRTWAEEETASYGVLTDADGLVIAHPDALSIGLYLSQDGGADTVAFAENAVALEQPVDLLELRLIRVVDRDVLLGDANRYTLRMTLALAVLTILFVLVAAAMVQRIIRSIRRLKEGLEAVEAGNLDALVRTRQINEIGEIVASFNRMTARLRTVSAERERETCRAVAAMDNLRAAEIRALENQINSHFLHNTLATISFTAIHAGDHDASRQIQHLSKMLRYTFERSTGVVPIREEADWLIDYLELQRLRFGGVFDYRIIIHPSVGDWPVHKLILQPFVENSLLHGFEGCGRNGVIEVRIAPFDVRRIRVTIRDKGKGMPPEQVARLNQCFASPEAERAEEGIGLENAALRIRNYYRGGARVIFRSWAGVGTAVTIILPRAETSRSSTP